MSVPQGKKDEKSLFNFLGILSVDRIGPFKGLWHMTAFDTNRETSVYFVIVFSQFLVVDKNGPFNGVWQINF